MSKSDNIKLSMFGLPVMETLEDFSKLTHLSCFTIYQLSKQSKDYYKVYEIKKKSGKPRVISQPNKKLKGLQSWILHNILRKLKVSTCCKGFEQYTSTLDNALPHQNASIILTIDLKDFFSSVKRYKVFNIFKSIGYNNLISTILTNTCVYNDCLPQGGPCSPKLANLSAWPLDVRLQGYVGKRGIAYTRYADDLTFSSLNRQNILGIIPFISSIVKSEDLEVNVTKTRIAGLGRSKVVTGLVISDDGIGVGRTKFKTIRAKIHNLSILNSDCEYKRVHEVQGWLAYLKSVDSKRYYKALDYARKMRTLYPNKLISKLNLPPKVVAAKVEISTLIVESA